MLDARGEMKQTRGGAKGLGEAACCLPISERDLDGRRPEEICGRSSIICSG